MVEASEAYGRLSPFELRHELIRRASTHRGGADLNAGRGNPNWLAATPREALFTLGQFAVAEATSRCGYPDMGFHARGEGIHERFLEWVADNPAAPGLSFLRDAVAWGVAELGFDPDAWLLELVQAVLGDFYPAPDRMLPHVEAVVHAYLLRHVARDLRGGGRFDLFATEGGTAAMRYCFDSLMENRLLRHGDTIAIATPTFTPYLEIPSLDEFGLRIVEIAADEDDDWQYPDAEIDKLRDPAIRAFFVVNPGNPTSRAIRPRTLERIAALVRDERPDLIIVTDDVYATFVGDFRSIASVAPANTILVYSFSKHFGCTGWRLAVLAIHQDNVMDRLIAALPEADRAALHERYRRISLDPDGLKLIDRMVADSRSVALNHTAGLSLPQQAQMALFALFFLLDDGIAYINATRAMLFSRLCDLSQTLGLAVHYDPANSDFYATIDLLDLARARHGRRFAAYLQEHHDPLDLILALAERQSVVVLPGRGFDGPAWSIRISLANLADTDYVELGSRVSALLDEIYATALPAPRRRQATTASGDDR